MCLCVCGCVLHMSGDWGANSHSTTLELAPGTWHIIWLANPLANEGILGEGVSARWSCVSQVRKIQTDECVRVFFFLRGWNRNALLLHVQSRRRRFRPTRHANPKDLGREDLMFWKECDSSPFPSTRGGSGREKVKKEKAEQSVQGFRTDILKPCVTCTHFSSRTVHALYPTTPEPNSLHQCHHVWCFVFKEGAFVVDVVTWCGYMCMFSLLFWRLVYFSGCVLLLLALGFFSFLSVS